MTRSLRSNEYARTKVHLFVIKTKSKPYTQRRLKFKQLYFGSGGSCSERESFTDHFIGHIT